MERAEKLNTLRNNGKVYDRNWKDTAIYATRKIYNCQSCDEMEMSNQITMANSTYLKGKFQGKKESSVEHMNSSSLRYSYHKYMTEKQLANLNKQAYEREALGTIVNNSKAGTTFEHSAMSNLSLTQHKKPKGYLEIQSNSQGDLLSNARHNSNSISNLMYHSNALNASFNDGNRTNAKKIGHKSKGFEHPVERKQKLNTLINSKHRHYSLSRHKAKEVSYKKFERRKHLMQKAIFGKKLKRLFEDLESLFLNIRDKKMIGTFLRGLYNELKDKNTVKTKHKLKSKRVKGHESKDRSDKGHEGKGHEGKGHKARRLKILKNNKRQNAKLRRTEVRNKHLNRTMNFSSPLIDSKSRPFSSTHNKQEFLKYILAQNIMRSGWPFLLQKRNRTESNDIINVLRERIALKAKDVNDVSGTAATTSPLETMKVTPMNYSLSQFHNDTLLPLSSSSGKSEVNVTEDQPALSLVQPSYKFVSTAIEKTPYLPLRSQWHASSQAIAPASLEMTPKLLLASSSYIPYASTSKYYRYYHLTQHSRPGNKSTVLQRVSNESLAVSLKLQTLSYTSSFATVLNSSLYVSFDSMSDARSSIYTKANISSSYSTTLANDRTVVSSDNARLIKSSQEASNLDEELMSDLMDAYEIVLEEKLSRSSPPYATVNYPTKSNAISRVTSSSLQHRFITSTSYKRNNSLDIVLQSRDTYSTPAANIDKYIFPLIDEEATLPHDGVHKANRSEVEDKFEYQKNSDDSSNIGDNERSAAYLQQQTKTILQQNNRRLIKSSLSHTEESMPSIDLTGTTFTTDPTSLSSRNLFDIKLTDDNYRNAADENESNIFKETRAKNQGKIKKSNAREIDANIEGIQCCF